VFGATRMSLALSGVLLASILRRHARRLQYDPCSLSAHFIRESVAFAPRNVKGRGGQHAMARF